MTRWLVCLGRLDDAITLRSQRTEGGVGRPGTTSLLRYQTAYRHPFTGRTRVKK